MYDGNIRRIPRSCVSYHPGHQAHWIHAKEASVQDPLSISSSIGPLPPITIAPENGN